MVVSWLRNVLKENRNLKVNVTFYAKFEAFMKHYEYD